MLNSTMFQSIKAALNKNNDKSGGSGLYNEIMKTAVGNTYTVRLLPDSKSPADTFLHYYIHGWNSFATGAYVQAISPQTFGERDPISEERFRAKRTGTDDEKSKMEAVRRSEKWLVNVYVIDDPANPENNGKVKILRYGKQLQKIILEAIEGEDAEEYGVERVFDLGPEGVNLKIKVEQQGDYPSYVSSRFTAAGKLKLSEDEQQKIYDSVNTLKDVFTVKSFDELKQMVDEHVYVKLDKPAAPAAPAVSAPTVFTNPTSQSTSDFKDLNEYNIDDDLDNLLKDL
jgi:hypothetical protein